MFHNFKVNKLNQDFMSEEEGLNYQGVCENSISSMSSYKNNFITNESE